MSDFKARDKVKWNDTVYVVIGTVETLSGGKRVVIQREGNSATISVVHPDTLTRVPLCEYDNRTGRSGDCGQRNPAVWRIERGGVRPCCGIRISSVRHVCDYCWDIVETNPTLKCSNCGERLTQAERWTSIKKVERIS